MTILMRAQIRPGVLGIDTTVKSAQELWRTFAPRWEMVIGHKKGTVSKEPRPSRRGFCKPRGNVPPLRYGLPFLPALPSGASWQIFVMRNIRNSMQRFSITY
jgi:hypothetical protein